MMEALLSSETSVLTRTTWRNIPENGILHNHHQLAVLYREIEYDTELEQISFDKSPIQGAE
jgi:hypothetical protein